MSYELWGIWERMASYIYFPNIDIVRLCGKRKSRLVRRGQMRVKVYLDGGSVKKIVTAKGC